MTAPCRISGMGQSVYTAAPLSSSAAVYSSKRAMAFKKPLPFSVSQNAAVRCFPCFSTLSGGYCGIFYRKWLKTCINCINPCKKRHLTVSASQYAGSPSRLKCCFPQLCRVFSGKHRHSPLYLVSAGQAPFHSFLPHSKNRQSNFGPFHGIIAAKRPLYACCARRSGFRGTLPPICTIPPLRTLCTWRNSRKAAIIRLLCKVLPGLYRSAARHPLPL